MASYPFLSPDWIRAARELRTRYAEQIPDPAVPAKINVVITEIPHGDHESMNGHIDTSEGQTIIEDGHLDKVDLTVTVDYETAKAAFVTRDQEVLMRAFFGGKILVEGDVSRLMALQTAPTDVDPVLVEMYHELNALTEDA